MKLALFVFNLKKEICSILNSFFHFKSSMKRNKFIICFHKMLDSIF